MDVTMVKVVAEVMVKLMALKQIARLVISSVFHGEILKTFCIVSLDMELLLVSFDIFSINVNISIVRFLTRYYLLKLSPAIIN